MKSQLTPDQCAEWLRMCPQDYWMMGPKARVRDLVLAIKTLHQEEPRNGWSVAHRTDVVIKYHPTLIPLFYRTATIIFLDKYGNPSPVSKKIDAIMRKNAPMCEWYSL